MATHEWKPVWLVYRRPMCLFDNMVQVLGGCGDFTHMELYFPHRCVAFCNFMFHNMEKNTLSHCEYESNAEYYAVQEIFMSAAHHDKLLRWCEDKVSNNTTYNYSSVARLMLPRCMHASEDKALGANPKLFCSEAAILALRDTLPEHDPVLQALQHLVAVSATPGDVSKSLQRTLGEPKPIASMLPTRHLKHATSANLYDP